MDVHVQRMVVVTPAIPEQLLDRLHKLGDVWSEAGSPQLASATTPVTLTPGISTARTAPTVEWVRVRQAEPSGTVFTRSFGPTPDYSPAELETAARAMTVEETPLDLGRPDVVESMFVVSAAFSESGAGMRWYDRSCSGDGPTREGESCSENIQ